MLKHFSLYHNTFTMVVISVAPKTISASKKQKRDSFKIIAVVFRLHHVLFALDFGFFKFKTKKIKVIFKILSTVQCLFFCFTCTRSIFYPTVHRSFFWYTIVVIRYMCIAVLLLLFKSDVTFYNLFHDLEIVDQGLNIDITSFNLDVKIVLATIFCISYRVTVTYTYCAVTTGICILTFWKKLLLTFIVECGDFVLITYTFVFYSVYCRMEKLMSALEIADCNIVSLHRIYKSLVDVADKHKTAFDLIFLTSLLCNVPEAMSTIYLSVMELLRKKTTKQSLELCADYATVAATLSLTFAPALFAGMLTAQANKIKVELYNKLIIQQDEVSIREIERFIRYVGARGCQYRVWKVVPLDASFIGMVIGFCLTYLIVIIQFTHLY